jgi:hypothetical protein
MSRGKTIQIYLTDGEPTGIRTAELTTSISKAAIVPHKRVGEADKRGELRQLGLYFLFVVSGMPIERSEGVVSLSFLGSGLEGLG